MESTTIKTEVTPEEMGVMLEEMNQLGGYKAIQWAQDQKLDYGSRPSKPMLPAKHNTQQVQEYAIELQKWEANMELYNVKKNVVQSYNRDIDSLIRKFIEQEVGLDIVPKQYRDKLWSHAWADGHSDGWYSVYQKLQNLIYIFE